MALFDKRISLGLTAIWMLSLFSLGIVSGTKMVEIGSYNNSAASICISIPPDGFTFEMTKNQRSLKKREITEILHENNSKRTNRSKRSAPSFTSEWVMETEDEVEGVLRLQYFVRPINIDKLYWAGETIVPADYLVDGAHILDYQQNVVLVNRLALKVKWNNEELPFEISNDRLLTKQKYLPHHVSLYGPASITNSATAICFDNRADDLIGPLDYPHTQMVSAVTTTIIVSFLIGGILLMVFLRFCCRTGKFRYRRSSESDVFDSDIEEQMPEVEQLKQKKKHNGYDTGSSRRSSRV